ncbi:EGF-like domain-containing protein, putative [Eimeria tenella]|uniref:EGF-like domain-containing protein, putative n=1 Tax=Eimeria tenella TaxID=5802 RepID=U6L1T3_EIMTE|nr:EGF-like domain-containing protein, putative [Eimeria tenella]CDJ43153.1 EGF-like domain-containing protein, putative [Eimeria tenella]|eukprot:XP_013233903.1 EGF-like domain-containing protein, putative [Eimeria tenella]
MNRFNIPANHIQLEWAKSGSSVKTSTYKGKTYTWLPRSQTAGVKVGYATMWDRSSKGYCTRSDAQVDTQRYLGQRLMAVGACPNYGKYIAFVDRSGNPVDSVERFTNEIHGNTMPFSIQGCTSTASVGTAEVPMGQSGWSMYSGYLVKCPFNQAVYDKDMLLDAEYDPNACSFVTLENPLVFLDTSQKEGSLAYKPYAFHGQGGHKGYDFVGSGVGCPPFSPPQTTRPMKSPGIITDPFLCSQLSRCTSMCWPWDANRPCYRSLPASFNHSTSECLILGYHTQTYINDSCTIKSTDDPTAKYCVKAHKTVESSNYTYVTAFTRPDFETACPPREPLKNVVFGTISGGVCTQLASASTSTGTAGECGQAVFEASSDDSPSGAGGSGSSSIFWSSWIPQSASTQQGTCNLYSTVPTCLFKVDGAISFTALSAADPSLAKDPPSDAITPGPCSSNPCKNGGTCELPGGTCKCPACFSGSNCETRVAGCCASNADCGGKGSCVSNKCKCNSGYSGPACEKGACDDVQCQNSGTCKMPSGVCECPEGFSGLRCETSVCDQVTCENGGQCEMPSGKCKCPACFTGDHCETKNPRCCETDNDCNSPQGKCVFSSCQCAPSITGDKCDNSGCAGVTCLNGGTCNQLSGHCKCPKCYSGSNCETHEANCCESDSDCNAPNGVCNSSNTCECTPEFPAANCVDLCSGVECSNDGKCDPATGKCTCLAGWGGPQCIVPQPCGTEGAICSGNATCDQEALSCVCKPGYTGEDCTELSPECSELCTVGGSVIRDSVSECKVDCYSACCKHLIESCKDQSEDNQEQCVKDALQAEEDESCCVAREEGSSNAALYAIAGVAAALLVLGAAGGMYYKNSMGAGASGEVLDNSVGEAVGGKHRPTRQESAISVDFEDYANTPDDATGDLQAEGETAQEADWDVNVEDGDVLGCKETGSKHIGMALLLQLHGATFSDWEPDCNERRRKCSDSTVIPASPLKLGWRLCFSRDDDYHSAHL